MARYDILGKTIKTDQVGFNLLELLLVLFLVSVLLSWAFPQLRALIQSTARSMAAEQLLESLYYARSEAMTKHCVVTICKSKDKVRCGGQWQDGWIVFVDRHGDGQVHQGDLILKVFSGLMHHQTLQWQGARSNDYLQFDLNGAALGQNGHFTFLDSNRKIKESIIVSQTGRVRRVTL
jgi:type IV fimbrial biogenesis protein FimT